MIRIIENFGDSKEVLIRSSILMLAVSDAALAASAFRGKRDGKGADGAATTCLRETAGKHANAFGMRLDVVTSEGVRDEAPMLHIGERIGADKDQVDCRLAVDAVENTNACKLGLPGAVCVLAYAIDGEGELRGCPDSYLDKFATSREIDHALRRFRVDRIRPQGYSGNLDPDVPWLIQPKAEVIKFAAAALARPAEMIRVEILDRERNGQYIEDCLRAGAQVSHIQDGDILSVFKVCSDPQDHELDFLFGIGAAPEGVIGAAIARAMRGCFEARVAVDHLTPEIQAGVLQGFLQAGFDPSKVYAADELASGNVGFIMAAITDAGTMRGVRYLSNGDIRVDLCHGRTRTGRWHQETCNIPTVA